MNEDKPLYEEESLVQRIKESPRTVSALIIILIVAAAIYAFSGEDQGARIGQVAEGEATTQDDEAGDGKEAAIGEGETTDEETPEGEVAAARDGEEAEEETTEAENIPEARKTDAGYVEVAQVGDGYTNLARRATTKWLSENQASYSVTDEHRIFIEDYIQNKSGSGGMEIGQEQMISFDLVREAVEAAGELSETELQNLSQYTSALE